ncbi:agmatinase family protein [Pendulispora rubella]|uniref:Agmatinase family protein n=1 Tax=Pendulispora rubella TaxID=2741070 RepID=A0ABZ2L0L2_9BACT
MPSDRPFDPNAAAPADSGVFGLSDTPEEAGVVLIPVPWDVTTSYRAGTHKGPQAILEASRQVDLFDIETGRPYEAKIAMLDEREEIRAWNGDARVDAEAIIAEGGRVDPGSPLAERLAKVNAVSRRVNDAVYETARHWIARKKIVGLVGGDHSTPYGTIRAHAEAYPGLGILHVDAHADLRHAYEGFEYSHASIMESVTREIPGVARLVQVGIRDLCEEEHDRITASNGKIRTFYDVDLAASRRRGQIDDHFARIARELPDDVYVSFDIDGLDPVLCPNTGTPVPGGLAFHEASALLRAVVEAKKRIVGFDLNEVAPSPDSDDEWDGNVGARILYKMIGWTLKSRT